MRRFLVLGSNSFVGAHLLQELNERGADVIATVRSATNSPMLSANIQYCDLTDREQVDAAVQSAQPECVINLAGATTSSDPRVLYDLHVSGTLHLLRAVTERAPRAVVVLLGSAAEYGPATGEMLPISETATPNPSSFFGASKLAQTHAAAAAAQSWGLRVITLRPFNIIGPGLPSHYMPAAFARRLQAVMTSERREPLTLQNGHATRDFVDVRDVVQAILLSAESAAPPPGRSELFNVASGQAVSIHSIAEQLAHLAGDFPLTDAGAAESRSNVSRSCGDATRLRNATGWQPRIAWRESLADLWNQLQAPCAA